jgi:hypothetical protein
VDGLVNTSRINLRRMQLAFEPNLEIAGKLGGKSMYYSWLNAERRFSLILKESGW